jgi:AmmeMemoRadiSam system protein A
MHPLVRLAKDAVELYVRDQKVLTVRDEDMTPEMRQTSGVFICLKVRGMLRGCIGTFQPCEPDIAREIVRNAVSAATCDPRFSPVRKDELADIEYSVDVLTTPEPVKGKQDLDPKRYGVIVQAGGRKGLLLPDLEGVDSVEEQVLIATRKAGILPGTPVDLFRFEVKRYH